MKEFQKYFNEEFFIIDSDNLNYIGNKLFGFLIDNEKIITSNNISNITGEGTYIYIEDKNNEITIYQDFNGNYGLYIFQTNEYFAISNSFLKLVEYLKNKYELTLNKDYANYFMTSGLNSTIYKETLVNEIEIIPRNKIIG